MYDAEHEYFYTWEFGRERVGNSIITQEMPNEIRHQILYRHLVELLEVANNYDEQYYFFIV